MTDANAPITVGCFGAPEEQTDLQRSLLRVGYRPGFINVLDEFTAAADHPPGTFVLFCGSSGGKPEHKRAVLDACPLQPAMTILRLADAGWAESVLQNSMDFLFWPCSDQELAMRLERLPSDTNATSDLQLDPGHLAMHCGLIGTSIPFRRCLSLILKLSRCDAPVLITAETGTGKELAARAIHYLGPRKANPFVPCNCGALPDNLVENELFGHERGAFTDAKQKYPGLVAQAEGGTLFLDEIETLSAKAQAVLLRFLEDQEYRPLGGTQLRRADVRLIAASNAELFELVRQGQFRQDLMYRLNVVQLSLPPLRERKEDIPLLADEFIRQASLRYKQPVRRLHPETMTWMEQQDWPGNVRELENFIHRAFVTSEGRWLYYDPRDEFALTDPAPTGSPPDLLMEEFQQAKSRCVHEFERRYLTELMRATSGNVSRAAKRAGKERRALGKLLKKHALDLKQFV